MSLPDPGLFSKSLNSIHLFPDFYITDSIQVYRIEQLSPVRCYFPLNTAQLCIADCYIVLHSIADEEKEEQALDARAYASHIIYTWIGSRAQLDKRFCAAMYAVNLRNLLKSGARVIRFAHGEESPDFLALWPVFEYPDASAGVQSGLYPVQDREYALLLYKIHGRFDFQLSLVRVLWLI